MKGTKAVGEPQPPPMILLKKPPIGGLIKVLWRPWSQNALNTLWFNPNAPILLS